MKTEPGKHGKNRNDGKCPESHISSQDSHSSHTFHQTKTRHPLIPPRGDPTTLKSFQKAEVVYDFTYRFAHKFLERKDCTIDQMIQAARSGKKNLLEGSRLGRTSKEMEIKLTNVAYGSLAELRDDYRDFLCAREYPVWEKDSKEALFVREFGKRQPQTYELYREFMETRPPWILANIAICLISQAMYLIDRQLDRLERDFVAQGGLREKMTRVRLAYRNKRHE
ncbi:MAG: four helix bundle suffix domain-containing protein [Candidatus Hydrogenedentota bacterium]